MLIYVLAFHRRHYIITSLPDNSDQIEYGMTKWQNGAMKKWRNGDMAMRRLLLRVGSPDLLFHSIDLGLGVEFGLINWLFEPIVPARHESRITSYETKNDDQRLSNQNQDQDRTQRIMPYVRVLSSSCIRAIRHHPSYVHTNQTILGFHNAYAAFSFYFRHSKPTRRKRVQRS